MTSFGVVARARHVLRVQRRQHAIVVASRPPSERGGVVQALGFVVVMLVRMVPPAVVVYAAWHKALATSDASSVRWGLLATAGVLLASGHIFQSTALSFSAREVLYLPDKAGTLLARLLRALPVLLWIGSAWAVATWLCLRGQWAERPVAVGAMCTIAALAPLSRTAARLLQRLVAPGAGSVLTPAFLFIVCAWALSDRAMWRGDWERVGLGILLIVIACMQLAVLAHGAWMTTRASMCALWLDLAHVPRTIVLVVLVAPPPVWSDSTWSAVAVCLGVASIVVLAPFALLRALREVNRAEAETGGAVEYSEYAGRPIDTRSPTVTAPSPHRGRSPWRARWRLYWLQRGITWRDLLRPLVLASFLARHGIGIASAAIVVWAAEIPPALLLVFVIFAPSEVRAAVSRERLYLLGVDLREQLRLQVIAVLWSVVVPTLFVAVLVATLLGWNEKRLLVVAALAAGFMLRIGGRGMLPRPEFASAFRAVAGLFGAWIVISIAADARPEAMFMQWPIVGIVALLGLIGFVRRVVLWREPELLADMLAARERASQRAA